MRPNTRLPFPLDNNVERLDFQAVGIQLDPFLDALFEICLPKEVYAKLDVIGGHTSNHFFEFMVREVLEEKKTNRECPRYLKHVQILIHHKRESLTSSHSRTFDLDMPIHFKLDWC